MESPMTTTRSIIDQLRPIGRPARVLYWGAALWLASAVVHLVALAGDGWSWDGAVSFRKPLTFSLSIGLLLATSGWILDRLPGRPRLSSVLAWTLLVSSTGEVGLITLQAWRGRASHFNTLQAGDAIVFAAMGAFVGVMSLCLVTLLVWSIVRRPSDPLVSLAIIAGMVLVTTGLGIGQWIIELGNDYVASNGVVPETVVSGEAGVAKFPHAIAFHGVQLFIVTALVLRLGNLVEIARRRVMWLVVAGYTGLLVFASAQTIMGQTPLQPGGWTLGLTLSVIAVLVGAAFTVLGLRSRAPEYEETGAPVA